MSVCVCVMRLMIFKWGLYRINNSYIEIKH